MVSVTSVSCYIMSASRYLPHYQSRSSMYIRGLIPRNFVELAEAVPIGVAGYNFQQNIVVSLKVNFSLTSITDPKVLHCLQIKYQCPVYKIV